tara:strand:+ start:106 stop:537 length:432 start_codon:yes stop_codon:yes gene_type:complete
MGLRTDLEKVFVDNMSDSDGESIELTKFQKKKVKQLAVGIADAMIDFIQKQTFQITEMEATVDIEEIRTLAPLTGVPAVPGAPVIIGGTPSTPTPFVLSKTGGAGGTMIPKAKAYIGPKSNKNVFGLPNVDKTKVKLINVKNR